MAIGTDFSIDKDTRVIDYTGSAHEADNAGYHKVIDFHRWLGDLSDDTSATGNDVMSIVYQQPSDRQGIDNIIQMTNGYTITQAAAEHLYDGSIIQNDGDDIWDAIVVLAGTGSDFNVQIMQNGALVSNDFWNNTPHIDENPEGYPGLNRDTANGIATQFLLKVRTSGADIDGRRIVGMTRVFGYTYSEFPINGTGRGNNSLPLTFAADLNNETAIASMTTAPYSSVSYGTQGYAALDVDNDTTDEYYIEEWDLGTATPPQAYERWKYLTRHMPTASADTLHGLTGTIYRGVTHEIAVDTPSGTFSAFEQLSWGSGATAGTGQMLAINSTTTPTRLFLQLLTGVAPVDTLTLTGATSSATCEVNGSFETRTINGAAPFCGVSTGAAIIGSYGLGVTPTDLTDADKLFDLDDNGPNSPPTYATFSVNGLDTGGDVVLVAPRGYQLYYDASDGAFTFGETVTFNTAGTSYTAKVVEEVELVTNSTGILTIGPTSNGATPTDGHTIDGGTSTTSAEVDGTPKPAPDLGQYTLSTALTTATEGSVVVTETIDSDMPSSGTIRVQDNNGVYRKLNYDSFATSTFTLDTDYDFSTTSASSGNNVMVTAIDKAAAADPETFTIIHNGTDRTWFVRVRDGGATPKKQVETTGTLGTAGGSVNVSLQSDE